MEKKSPIPTPRDITFRRQIAALLQQGPQSVRDLSAAVGIPEKEVPTHLEHLRKSLRGSRKHLEIVPAACRNCGFAFGQRTRFERPGRCPICRGQSITLPRFRIP